MLAPSEDLMNTVSTPAALARRAIAAMLPPSLRHVCQIHMPSPSNAVPEGVPDGAWTRAPPRARTVTGPEWLDQRPPSVRSRTLPLRAAEGTRTTRLVAERRRTVWATTPPPRRGKTTRSRGGNRVPRSSMRPPAVTIEGAAHDASG